MNLHIFLDTGLPTLCRLHLIDFEQLKIENQTVNEKIEERNEELLKLRKKNTTTVQVNCVEYVDGFGWLDLFQIFSMWSQLFWLCICAAMSARLSVGRSGCLTLLGTKQSKFHVGLLTAITLTRNPAADPYPYEGEAAVRCSRKFCHEPPGEQG